MAAQAGDEQASRGIRASVTALLVAWLIGFLSPETAAADPMEATDLLGRAVRALPKLPFVAQLRLTTPTGPRELELHHKLIAGVRASYLEVKAPDDLKGMRFLFIEHRDNPPEQYVKVTAARRSVLVTGEARSQPFLGSTFCVADLVEPEVENASHTYVGEDNVLGRRCRVVESIPAKRATAVYGRTMTAVDPEDLLVLKRQFFDQKDRLQKIWQVTRLEKVEGTWTVMEQSMTNVQERTTSRLEVVRIKLNVDLPDAMFTPGHLLH
jgi:hypothetical protein